ncbi:hypothetical protein O181_064438, partial [Austropuccinia psidii MF-1]|nr:hypothetical protein [Austropuccinia psidii MF-1]
GANPTGRRKFQGKKKPTGCRKFQGKKSPTGHCIAGERILLVFLFQGRESILLVNMSSNNLANRLLLNSENYFTWVTMMESELDNIGVLDLILETDHQETLNHKAYSLIIRYLNEDNLSFASSMLDQTNKRNGLALWKILKEKYMSNDISSQTLAFTKFSQVKFNSTLEFIQEIWITVSKMKLVGFKLEESALIIMVLSKLPHELNSFVRVMSHGFQNQGLDFILKKLEQDHIQFKLNEDSREATTALYSQRNKRYCNYCKKKSHLEEYCWKKYPEKKPANLFAQIFQPASTIILNNHSSSHQLILRKLTLGPRGQTTLKKWAVNLQTLKEEDFKQALEEKLTSNPPTQQIASQRCEHITSTILEAANNQGRWIAQKSYRKKPWWNTNLLNPLVKARNAARREMLKHKLTETRQTYYRSQEAFRAKVEEIKKTHWLKRGPNTPSKHSGSLKTETPAVSTRCSPREGNSHRR